MLTTRVYTLSIKEKVVRTLYIHNLLAHHIIKEINLLQWEIAIEASF
jgi:hypothetical protein